MADEGGEFRTPGIRFSLHATLKFSVLRGHGLDISERQVVRTVLQPANLSMGYAGRKVAQGPLDEERVLRVVYEETPEEIVIVTFYPGRRTRYE